MNRPNHNLHSLQLPDILKLYDIYHKRLQMAVESGEARDILKARLAIIRTQIDDRLFLKE